MVPWAHPSPQPKRHLDRFSRFAGLTSVIDRLTDHATRSVTIVRIYVRSTAMRSKKTDVDSRSFVNYDVVMFHVFVRSVCRLIVSLVSASHTQSNIPSRHCAYHIQNLFTIYLHKICL